MEFRLTVTDDDGDSRQITLLVDCEGSDLPERVDAKRGIHGADLTAELLTPVLESMVEAASADRGAVPRGVHQAVAAALGADTPATDAGPGSAPVRMLGSEPLTYPDVGSLTGKKKARTVAETPPIPDPGELTEIGRAAQPALRELVEAAGGRFGLRGPGNMIGEGHIAVFVDVMNEWAFHYGTQGDGGLVLSRPGLWHALERLYPLQDPNRIDRLRRAVIVELQRQGWTRNGVRGSKWWIPG